MPILAGWLTGEQVPQEIIEQTLTTMGEVLGRHGGEPARIVESGAGLLVFSDSGHAMQRNDDPPVLDWVSDRRTLVYRRPLSGLHTLYYITDWPAEGNLLFASEIKALLAVGAPRRLHLASLDALLRYGFIPAPWTAFQDIHVVPAGSILRWQRAKTVVNQSTDYHFDELLPSGDALEQLHTSLNDATAALLPPHEQLVALTGGGSSSALSTALAAHHTQTPFNIVSLGYKKSIKAKVWEDAEALADACQRPFLAITGADQPEFWIAAVTGLESPSVDTRSLALHQLLHTATAETEARVAISGLGAHLLFGTQANKLTGLASVEPQDMLNWYAQTLRTKPDKAVSRLWSKDAATSLQQEERWEDCLQARKLARHAAQFSDKSQGWYYLDLHLRLPDYVVNVAQQLAMQESLAVRSPYLNTHVMDMLTRLPAILENGTTKASLLTSLAQRYVPYSVATPSKLPLLAPTASLFKVADSDLLRQMLSREALQATGIFDPLVVEGLLEKKRDETALRELLLVFTTQLLCQLFGVGL